LNRSTIGKIYYLIDFDILPTVAIHFRFEPKSSKERVSNLKIIRHSKNLHKYIHSLIDIKWLSYTITDNPKNRNQKYITTPKGKLLLKLMKKP
jgi:hypothetical protein